MNLEKEIFDISLQDIIPNRFQPREMFDDEALKELSQSIREHGVIQPIIVRKVGDKYEIIAGERRFRASQLAGKQTIPALVRDIDDKEAAKIALLENLQRSNLTPIEEAKTYQTILKLDNITQEELAQNLGKSQSTIANKLRLLTLDEEVQTALLNSQISERHARSLIGVDNETQRNLLHKIINEKLTVKGLDDEIMKINGTYQEPQIQGANEIISTPQMQSTIETPIINQNQMITNPTIQETPTIETNNVITPPVTNQVPINEPVINQNIEPQPEQNNITNQIETPVINSEIPQPEQPQININQQEPKHQENIFDRLRVTTEEPTSIQENEIPQPEQNNITNQIETPVINSETQNQEPQQNYNNIYDLRFAINNFRQAIQNTEKFGFKVKADEYDSENKYQIVIEIEKK